MPTFTLNQKKAHDHQRHISITANAGSGKTSVLVSRYCDLVEFRGFDPQEIAAITFTEKAAAELRGRIAKEFESRLSDDAHRANWPRLKTVRESFPSAVVTTIHGFCSQMLREFPIEADVPPNFAVISGYERTDMEEAALMEAIEQALADEPEEQFEAAYDTVRRVGRERAETILRLMLANRESILLSRRDGALSLDRERALDRWEQGVDAAVRGMILNAVTRPAISEMVDCLKEEFAKRAAELLGRAERARTIEEFLENVNELLNEVLLTKSGTPRRKCYDLSGEEFGRLEGPVGVLGTALKHAADFLSANSDPAVHAMLFDDARMLLRIFDRAVELYTRRKDAVSGLDFEDLQLRLYETLESGDARERISGRFRYIMVDEFQDTNELQYQLVRRMARDLTDIDLLCVVGDRKQSIYGFRGAEVEVFAEATRDIQRVNRDKGRSDYPFEYRAERIEPESREEGLGEIHLETSFRLLPGICAYVNQACASIMRGTAGTEYGVEYEPLVSARRSPGRGVVEAILVRPESTEDEEESGPDVPGKADDDYMSEAELIARRIHAMVANSEHLVWDCPEGSDIEQARPPRFSDIAILCRKRSMFADIEKALRAWDIPFLTHGGTGFFRSQEVYDVVNYLRTLLNDRDDVALLGVLRSPFFAVSDVELYRISIQPGVRGENNDLWSRAVRWSESGRSGESLARALRMIADDRSMASRIPVSLLLNRIVERTGWRGAVVGSERGEQMLANVDKLIDMAREFEARGFTNLFDFVERVNAQIDSEEAETEAAINTSRDAVRLMTMHGAKGLEFPIVFLPSLHAPTRTTLPPYFDKELGFGWNWTFNGVEYRPMVTALMKLKQRMREEAEEARLFYVAVTRARDALVLCGQIDGEPRRGTMLDWGLAPLPFLPEGNDDVELRTASLGFLEPDGATISRREWVQDVAIRRDIYVGREHVAEPPPHRFRIDLLQIGEIPARARGEIYSATQFLTYSQCPTKYYLRYRLGIPEELSIAWLEDPEATDSEDGTMFARLFREAARAIGDDADITEEEIAALIDDILVLEAMDEAMLSALRARLAESFLRVLSSHPARARLFPEGATTETAKELRIPFEYGGGREYILGVMDRLTAHPDGTLSFLQFKTLRLDDADPAEIAAGYLPQLRLYAWLVSALNPDQRSVRGTILFTEAPDAPQDFTFTRLDLVRIEEEIRTNIEDIRALSYTGRGRLPLLTPHCPICPYWIEKECLLGKEG